MHLPRFRSKIPFAHQSTKQIRFGACLFDRFGGKTEKKSRKSNKLAKMYLVFREANLCSCYVIILDKEHGKKGGIKTKI